MFESDKPKSYDYFECPFANIDCMSEKIKEMWSPMALYFVTLLIYFQVVQVMLIWWLAMDWIVGGWLAREWFVGEWLSSEWLDGGWIVGEWFGREGSDKQWLDKN